MESLCAEIFDSTPYPIEIVDGYHIERGGYEFIVKDYDWQGRFFDESQIILFHFSTKHQDADGLAGCGFRDAGLQIILTIAVGDGQLAAIRTRSFFNSFNKVGEELCIGEDTAGFAVNQEIDNPLMLCNFFDGGTLVTEFVRKVEYRNTCLFVDTVTSI